MAKAKNGTGHSLGNEALELWLVVNLHGVAVFDHSLIPAGCH
jgi:hypothetical protein